MSSRVGGGITCVLGSRPSLSSQKRSALGCRSWYDSASAYFFVAASNKISVLPQKKVRKVGGRELTSGHSPRRDDSSSSSEIAGLGRRRAPKRGFGGYPGRSQSQTYPRSQEEEEDTGRSSGVESGVEEVEEVDQDGEGASESSP